VRALGHRTPRRPPAWYLTPIRGISRQGMTTFEVGPHCDPSLGRDITTSVAMNGQYPPDENFCAARRLGPCLNSDDINRHRLQLAGSQIGASPDDIGARRRHSSAEARVLSICSQMTTRQSTDACTNEALGEEDMSFLITQPAALTAAVADLAAIGSAMNALNAAEAAPTTGLVPAAADLVSALTAAAFAAHGALYQEVSAQAAAIHHMFVATLQASAGSYAATEAANVTATR
jgi:PE family